MNAHEIEYGIVGNDLQCVSIGLNPDETIIAESGSLMMESNVKMDTIFGYFKSEAVLI